MFVYVGNFEVLITHTRFCACGAVGAGITDALQVLGVRAVWCVPHVMRSRAGHVTMVYLSVSATMVGVWVSK